MSLIPKGWKVEPLADLLIHSIGGIWGDEAGSSEVDVDVIRVTELKAGGRIETATAARRSVTQKQLASRQLRSGDLLLEKSGGGPTSPVGRVGLVPSIDVPMVCSNFMQLMRTDSSRALPKYLHYFLNFVQSTGGTIPMQTSSTNIRNIKSDVYFGQSVPVPPLDEQRRIVEILDDHFSRLDAAETCIASAKVNLSRFEKVSLHSVIVNENWSLVPLGDLLLSCSNGMTYANRPDSGGLPIARIQTISLGVLDFTKVGFAGICDGDASRYLLNAGDILLSHINSLPHLGKSAIYTSDQPPLIHGMNLLRLVPVAAVDPAYLAAALKTDFFLKQVRERAQHAVNQASINTKRLSEVLIPVPPSLKLQQDATQRVDEVGQATTRQALANEVMERESARLRRSLLHAAFTGQLTKEFRNV